MDQLVSHMGVNDLVIEAALSPDLGSLGVVINAVPGLANDFVGIARLNRFDARSVRIQCDLANMTVQGGLRERSEHDDHRYEQAFQNRHSILLCL